MAGGTLGISGGKVESGEVPEAALRRELREELGIHARQLVELRSFRHDYPDRSVEIALWLVTRFDGEARGLDGQALRWVAAADLDRCDLLEADPADDRTTAGRIAGS